MYLFYSPQTVTDVKLSTGEIVTPDHADDQHPGHDEDGVDPYVGYFQLSRFKFVEDANGPRLDFTSEQQILRVPNNRQECCHVAGDIDFDKHGNLWLVTGDDTPAGGINAGGYGPFNDQKTDEQQTVRVTATAGTFTLTFSPDDRADRLQRERPAGRRGARGALERRRQQHPDQRRRRRNTVNTTSTCSSAAPCSRPTSPDHRRRCGPDGQQPTLTTGDRTEARSTSGSPATPAAPR